MCIIIDYEKHENEINFRYTGQLLLFENCTNSNDIYIYVLTEELMYVLCLRDPKIVSGPYKGHKQGYNHCSLERSRRGNKETTRYEAVRTLEAHITTSAKILQELSRTIYRTDGIFTTHDKEKTEILK